MLAETESCLRRKLMKDLNNLHGGPRAHVVSPIGMGHMRVRSKISYIPAQVHLSGFEKIVSDTYARKITTKISMVVCGLYAEV